MQTPFNIEIALLGTVRVDAKSDPDWRTVQGLSIVTAVLPKVVSAHVQKRWSGSERESKIVQGGL